MRAIFYGWRNTYRRIMEGANSILNGDIIEDVPVPSSEMTRIGISRAIRKLRRDNKRRYLSRLPTSGANNSAIIGWGKFVQINRERCIWPINASIRKVCNKKDYLKYKCLSSDWTLKIRPRLIEADELDSVRFFEEVREGKAPALIGRTDLSAKKGQGAVLVYTREQAEEVLENGGILMPYYRKLRQFRTLFWRDVEGEVHTLTGIILKKRGAETPFPRRVVIISSDENYSISYKRETVQSVLQAIEDKGGVQPFVEKELLNGPDVDRVVREHMRPTEVVEFVEAILKNYSDEVAASLNYGAIDWAICRDGRIVNFEANSAPGISSPRSAQFFGAMLLHLAHHAEENPNRIMWLSSHSVEIADTLQ